MPRRKKKPALTPQQAIRIEAFQRLLDGAEDNPIEGYTYPESVDASNIDEVWDAFQETGYSYWLDENLDEIRCSGVSTGLRPREHSRHYECREVAACLSSVWVGWTYWFGGGKHGEPEAIDWVSNAYFVDVTEKRKTIKVRTFERDGEVGPPVPVLGGE